jgi:hypothetical protein
MNIDDPDPDLDPLEPVRVPTQQRPEGLLCDPADLSSVECAISEAVANGKARAIVDRDVLERLRALAWNEPPPRLYDYLRISKERDEWKAKLFDAYVIAYKAGRREEFDGHPSFATEEHWRMLGERHAAQHIELLRRAFVAQPLADKDPLNHLHPALKDQRYRE